MEIGSVKQKILKIGNVQIKGYAALAPMAGITDIAFREICKQYGASYTVSEMVSSKGISFLNKKTEQLMFISENEYPVSIQLFGDDPLTMSKAAKYALKFRPDMIDINMGCPAPKVSKNGCGCALMKNPDLCFKIVDAVKNSVNIPVTVKIRKGIDDENVNALEVSTLCESAGADAIAVHGRTQKQMYSGKADYDIVKQIKSAVKVPVIGSGDVTSASDALEKINHSGCDMLLIGRAALGNPWIFSQINYNTCFNVDIKEKVKVMLRHIKLLCDYKGELIGIKEARKHVAWYLKGLNGSREFRKRSSYLQSYKELIDLSNEVLNKNF